MADGDDVWVDSIEKYSTVIEKRPEPDNEPRWVEVAPGEKVQHMYNDPTNPETGFGGVKKKENVQQYVQRMKKILDDPKVDDVKKNEARRNLVDNDLVNTSHAYHARREMIRQVRVFTHFYR